MKKRFFAFALRNGVKECRVIAGSAKSVYRQMWMYLIPPEP